MNALLLDTNVIIRLFRGDESVAKTVSRFARILISPTVIGEYKMGLDPNTARGRIQKEQLDAFLDSVSVEVVPVTERTADFYARVYRELKDRGTPIPVNDMWIAASAIENNAVLYSHDDHFRHVPMLMRA